MSLSRLGRRWLNAFTKIFGSLGSRLHKSTSGSFVAYAQWPSLEAYESAHEWSIEGAQLRDNMSATLVGGRSTVLNQLILEVDMLKSSPHL